jgi:pimeloyl-ACP methyl ester carboxylesterase
MLPYVEVNGTKIHYHISGKGTPLVFIHSPLLTSATFQYQKAQLSNDFQVITFDIRGHGESAASEQKITYALLVEDIRQMLNTLKIDKAFLCGYSTGGSIVLEALLSDRERFMGGVIISGMSELSDSYNRGRAWLSAIFCKHQKLRQLVTASIAFGNSDMKTTFKNLYSQAMKSESKNASEYFLYSLKYDCTDRLSSIHQPVLLIYGEKDYASHKYIALMEKRLKHRTLMIVNEAKHQIPTKKPEAMNEIIRNWTKSIQNDAKHSFILEPHLAHEFNLVQI